MPLKSATAFRLTGPWSAEDLEAALPACAHRLPGPLEVGTLGFVPVAGSVYAHEAHGLTLLALREERKVVPAWAVRSRLAAAAAQREQDCGAPLSRTEHRDLKHVIEERLLAQALTTAAEIPLLIAPASGWLVVGTPSARRAEACVSRLRQALGALSAKPWHPPAPALRRMLNRWLGGDVPVGILPLDDRRWADDDGGEIRVRGLVDVATTTAIHRDHFLSHLRIEINEQLDCTVGDDGRLQRLVWSVAPEDDMDLASRLAWELEVCGHLLIDFLDLLDRHVDLHA